MAPLASLWFLITYLAVDAQYDKDAFGIHEPFPASIYPIEGTETKVTCVAFDRSGNKTAERIQFMRKDNFARYTNITASENVEFTERREPAVPPARDEIPSVTVSKIGVLKHGENTTLTCNLTRNPGKGSVLKRISWYKDGILLERIRNPDPDTPFDSLGPLVLNNNGIRSRDGETYTCFLEVALRNIRMYNVSDSTMVEITPGFNKPIQVVNLTSTKGENASLECAAQGFPLHVEWKYQKKGEDFVRPCIANDSDGKYLVHRSGIYNPYVLSITDVQNADLGSYYCCLPSNCSNNVQDNCQQFVLRELNTKKCDSKPSSSSSTVTWITAVSVEGAFLVAATAAIVMLVRKLRVKRTKEDSKVQTVESIYLEIEDKSVTNLVQNDAIQLGAAEHQTAPPCSKESGYSVLNHPSVAQGDGSYATLSASESVNGVNGISNFIK